MIVFLSLSMGQTLGQALTDEAGLRALVNEFAGARNFKQVEEIIEKLAGSGKPEAANALRGLASGTLMAKKDEGVVYLVEEAAGGVLIFDAVSGEPVTLSKAQAQDFEKIKIKNSLRRLIDAALSGLTLKSPSIAVRLKAAETIFETADGSALGALDEALKTEAVTKVREAFFDARASIVLSGDFAHDDKKAALKRIVARGGQSSLALLSKAVSSADSAIKPDIMAGIESLKANLALWQAGQNVWYGLSLGSVLLLAAIGLAITFGVMGVINMAHGEMVMLGAYTTFAVQEAIRQNVPDLFSFSLLIALPLAFLVSGGVGYIMERGLIRYLYGRPLETLLATWGVSLILQQAVRSLFGPTNREVGNPDWMSGAFQLGELAITWNRLWIIVFSLSVFAILYFVVNRSSYGLNMRAVTQNRRMAGAMGIRTDRLDALTFALGSGIAGIAGVALSQIDNVSPNLGQSYIIDSFLVVVLGGVGNLWGTLVGAMSLGIANKFLEPYVGAVLGKIIILVFIILFIQRRPRGIFALKGRSVEL